ncbi:AraC family transcriptional regulator [Nocardia wallacei]|uniref:HTH araC/xylS-type domain-containing protein n=1 Tax=Nocardia wallacei TaxID=480035 RepID=A0A7G1KNJ5_9NOCA|nr:helix-turn-helix domain-containing protein [Nocardia wallacei]BCK56670.1 hypothetical protein NWFMUON74_44420 [Nocardia wallacei]
MRVRGGGTTPERDRPRRVEALPHPGLRGLLVRRYHGYPCTGSPHERGSMPAGTAVRLVVKLADSPHRPPEFVLGPRDRCFPVEGPCAPSYLAFSLHPLAACAVLDTPGIYLRDCLLDLSDLTGRRFRDTVDRIRESRCWQDRFGLLDTFLLERADEGRRPPREVERAWSLLTVSGGAMTIGPIADEVGWSHKHLIARFTHHVGLTPKTAARLIRFDRLRQRLLRSPRPRLADLAATYGYADQPHLTREFREFAGETPLQYHRREIAADRS